MELLALSAPWILLLLVVVAIGLLLFKRWKVAVVLLILAVGGNWWFKVLPQNWFQVSGSSFDFAQEPSFDIAQEPMSRVSGVPLKVLSFNCNLSPKSEDVTERRAGVIKFIREQDADVVFLTENFIVREDSLWLEIQDMYPYRSEQNSSVGNRLYSKYPIVSDTLLKDKVMAYGITCCVLEVSPSTELRNRPSTELRNRGSGAVKRLAVRGVHLSSNNYNEQMEYMTPDSVATGIQAKTYLRNIVTAGEYRVKEAELINLNLNDNLNDNYVPVIVMGDFNDVSGSPTMRILESAGFKDAWWEGGLGYGATIHNPLPFRIDHILYNEGLKLRGIKKVSAKGLSDHDALVGTFLIK